MNRDESPGLDIRDERGTCRACGKPIASQAEAGNLAMHMLQDNYCSCQRGAGGQVVKQGFLQKLAGISTTLKIAVQSRLGGAKADGEFCPRCGLIVQRKSHPGSMTGYLFQDLRCRCAPEADFSMGAMSAKLGKLKQEEGGRTFSSAGGTTKTGQSVAIDLAPGAIIGGSFRILNLIGFGGMGEVYLAEHISLGTQYALKVIPPDQVTEDGWRRFRQEAKTIAKLDHINLVKVTDLGIHDGCLPFYAMEFIDGQTLHQMNLIRGPMSLSTAIDIFFQVCDGVGHAHHAGIIHRDLKPANIMVSEINGRRRVKILDFGLAKLSRHNRDHQSLTAAGDIFGSPFYMSPEQCLGLTIDNRSDIYSIGCTLFECLTGRPPFPGELGAAVIRSHEKDDPPSLENVTGPNKFPQSMEVVMAKLLRKNPVERYQTLTELKDDLMLVSQGKNVLPFYMSRSKQAVGPAWQEKDPDRQAQRAAADRPQANEPAAGKGGLGLQVKVASAIVLALGVGLAGGFFIANYRQAKPTVLSAMPKKDADATKGTAVVAKTHAPTQGLQGSGKDVADAAGADPEVSFDTVEIDGFDSSYLPKGVPKSASDTTPYCKVVGEGNRRYRLFTFPTDVRIGSIGLKANATVPIPASGIVRSGMDEAILFSPFPVIAKYPVYLNRFKPGDITTFEISTFFEPNELIHALADFKGLSALQGLRLRPRSKLDEQSLKILRQCTGVKVLYCNAAGLSERELSKFPFMKNLEYAELLDFRDVKAILKMLAPAGNLLMLELGDAPVDSADLLEISKFPKLQYLSSGNGLHTSEQIASLSKAPNLSILCLGDNFRADYKSIMALRSIKGLKELCVGSVRRDIDHQSLQQITSALPNVKIHRIFLHKSY